MYILQPVFTGFCMISLFPILTVAQNFTIPSTWQNPVSNFTRDQRSRITQDAIDHLIPTIDSAIGTINALSRPSQAASLFAVLALNDWITGNTIYKEVVTSSTRTFQSLHPDFLLSTLRLNSDSVLWGLTAYYAFRTYNDSFFLSAAVNVWDYTSQFFITEDQVNDGQHPLRNFTLPATCNGSSVAGGVFFIPDDVASASVNGETVGPFLALSAYLFEATSNETYLTSARLSARFIRDHLYTGTIIFDVFDVQTCQHSPDDFVFSYNVGFAVEGFSVLGNASKDKTWADFATNLVSTSIPYPAWTSLGGIIIEEDESTLSGLRNSFKRIFTRGLHEAWYRSNPNSKMARFIAHFLSIQFDSIMNHATQPGSNTYSPFWGGPRSTTRHWLRPIFASYYSVCLEFCHGPQTTSEAFERNCRGKRTFIHAELPGSPILDSPPSVDTGGTSSHNAGSIIGGAIGGVAAIAIALAVLIIYLIRRRRTFRSSNELSKPDIGPFDPSSPNHAPGIRTGVMDNFRATDPTPSYPTTTSITMTSFPGSAPTPSRARHHERSAAARSEDTTRGARVRDRRSDMREIAALLRVAFEKMSMGAGTANPLMGRRAGEKKHDK
ncbi:Six-hairpin glycosidase-like protein [Amylostereum chailletii]|nr:Six-hairpin glycosidase-like protein [Amylostereum chailletii]